VGVDSTVPWIPSIVPVVAFPYSTVLPGAALL
jgi:hypothetical protein